MKVQTNHCSITTCKHSKITETAIWLLQGQATWSLESLSKTLITSCKDRKSLDKQSKSQYHKTFNPAKTYILTLNLLILSLNKQGKADSGLGKG